MLSYAYQNLSHIGYNRLNVEEYENIHNLLASILVKGITAQLKEGLTRNYETTTDMIGMPRGKIDFSLSIKKQALQKQKVICHYNIFTENNVFNQILKRTMLMLIYSRKVDAPNKQGLKKLIIYFNDVNEIDYKSINWQSLAYQQNSNSYRLLMNICYLVIKGLLLTASEGTYLLADYLDDQQMHRLYERFILRYFQREHPELHARSAYIRWDTDDGYMEFLPNMRSDILLEHGNRTQIIDAKYYSKSMRISQYGTKESMIASHLYQIFAYVKNYSSATSGNVEGMLLYAKTDEDVIPNNVYQLSGNRISIKCLDLNTDWEVLVSQLKALSNELKASQI